MQEICKIQKYAVHALTFLQYAKHVRKICSICRKICIICRKICNKYAQYAEKYAKYAKKICSICKRNVQQICKRNMQQIFTILVTGDGSGRSCRHAGRVACIYCEHNRAAASEALVTTIAVDAPASGTGVTTPSILPPHARTVVLPLYARVASRLIRGKYQIGAR